MLGNRLLGVYTAANGITHLVASSLLFGHRFHVRRIPSVSSGAVKSILPRRAAASSTPRLRQALRSLKITQIPHEDTKHQGQNCRDLARPQGPPPTTPRLCYQHCLTRLQYHMRKNNFSQRFQPCSLASCTADIEPRHKEVQAMAPYSACEYILDAIYNPCTDPFRCKLQRACAGYIFCRHIDVAGGAQPSARLRLAMRPV